MTTISAAEKKARANLPITRFMQAYIPMSWASWLLKRSIARIQLNFGVTRETISADGVPCDWLTAPDASKEKVLLYLHGGGFVFGQTPLHLQMGAYLANKMKIRVLMVDYRLAPAHPFPAALNDCATAYQWLLKQGISAQDIVVAGDSAGGNLTITSLMKLRDDGAPLPAAAACLSPVVDLSDGRRVEKHQRDPLLHPKAMKFFNKAYKVKHDSHDPLISPIFGSLQDFPPLLIHAGEDEILREDAVRLTEMAKSTNIDVRLEIYPRMWHVWQLNLDLPQTTQSLDDIAQFLTSHLKPAA